MNAMKKDLAGKKFGKLTAIEPFSRVVKGRSRSYWVCVCECGNTAEVNRGSLRRGHTTSCGCIRKRVTNYIKETGSTVHKLWKSMMERCYREGDPEFHRYGARGIKVCERWHDFINFAEGMGNRPPGKTLDRKDNDGPYSPENCRWATHHEQARNRRNSVLIEYQGQTKTLPDWADQFGLHQANLRSRLKNGWDFHRAITEPFRSKPGAGNYKSRGFDRTRTEI